MRSFCIVIYYTIAQIIKKRSFWITNIVMATLLFLLFALLGNLKLPSFSLTPDNRGILEITYQASYPSGHDTTVEDIQETNDHLPNVLVIDNTDTFGDYLDLLYKTGYNFIIDNNADIETIKQEINDGTLYAAVVINEIDDNISFDYMILHDTNYNKSDAELIMKLLKQIQVTKILTEFNIPEEDINTINTSIDYNINILKDLTIINNATLVSLGLAFILFFAIYFYSYSVSASISSEKTSRVIETLIASTSPKHVILGKTAAMGLLGIVQLIFLCIACVLSYKFFISSDLTFLSEMINSINITTTNIILLIIYFILGYTLFAFLNAIAGATVSKPEDMPMAALPISLISMVSFILAVLALAINQDSINNFASMFPFASPFAMPGRILTGYAPFAEIAVSLLVLAFTVCLLAFIAIRIYSIAILHYGNRLKIKDLFNLFIKIK